MLGSGSSPSSLQAASDELELGLDEVQAVMDGSVVSFSIQS